MASSQIKIQITRYWIILCHDKFDQDPSVIKCVANCSLIDKNGVNARCEQLMSNYRQFRDKCTESAIILAIKRRLFWDHFANICRRIGDCSGTVWWVNGTCGDCYVNIQRTISEKVTKRSQIVPKSWKSVRQFIFFLNLAFDNFGK